ncbi:MAG: FG-GAP-like repeat-containing protein, partial [Phycisphaerales bacterium]
LALADLDGFGGLDLVRSRINGTTEIVDPFTSQVEFTMNAGGFNSFVVGDINQDGRDDLAAVNEADGLSWLTIPNTPFDITERRVTANGTFTSAALADIDPDGDLDLIGLEPVTVERGEDDDHNGGAGPERGTPTRFRIIPSRIPHRQTEIFGISQVAGFGDAPTSAVAADIDGDGTPDLAGVSFFDDAVSWWRFDGFNLQGWTKTVVATSANNPKADGPAAIAFGDLNADGRTDLIVGGILNNTVVWYENSNSGQTWTARVVDTVATGVSCLDAADVNADGKIDIVAGLSNGTVRVYFNNLGLPHGAPAFTVLNEQTDQGPVRAVVATDINRDGMTDLVAGTYASGRIHLLIQEDPGLRGTQAAFFFSAAPLNQPSPTALVVRDFTGDGRPDIAATSFTGNSVSLHRNVNSTTFATPTVVMASITGASALCAADLDLDGDFDLAAVGRQAFDVSRADNNGTGSFQQSSCGTSLEGGSLVIAADFNRDATPDLMVGSFNTDKYVSIENYSPAFSAFAVGEAAGLSEGSTAAVASAQAFHNGIASDLPFVYSRFSAIINNRAAIPNQPPSFPLTAAQINALISRIEVFADSNDNGQFDGADTSIGFKQGPFTIDSSDGFNTISFPLNITSPANRILPDAGESFFIVVTTQSNAFSQSPNTFSMLVDISGRTFSVDRFAEPFEPRFPGFYVGNTVTIGPDFRPYCTTDINQSGVTDTPDLVALLGSFGLTLQPYTRGDVNGDGRVTTNDLIRLLSDFGKPCQ